MTSPNESFEDRELDDLLGRSDQELSEAITWRVNPSEFIDRAMYHPDPASLGDQGENGQSGGDESEPVTDPKVPTAPEVMIPPKTSADELCDRCSAAAKLMIVLAGGCELFFCGYHANRYTDDLIKIAVQARAKAEFHWRGAEFMSVEEWPDGFDQEPWSHSLLPG